MTRHAAPTRTPWWAVPADSPLGREISRADDFDLIGREDPDEHGAGDVQLSTSHCTDLSLGLVDHRAVALFGHGDCAALARALHDQTGWPLALVRTAGTRPGDRTWVHAAVRRPDGLLVDIWGARPEQDAVDYWTRWDGGRIVGHHGPLTVADIDADAFDAECGRFDDEPGFVVEVTRHFAATVLAEAGRAATAQSLAGAC